METRSPDNLPQTNRAYNGFDRNAFLFGFTPQAELWNGRLAMIGFLIYFLWDLAGYSVIHDLFHWGV
jgi:hypothetical protein